MALFTDADIVTLDDLLVFETSLVQVASSHGINVETKISLAASCISDRLLLSLLSVGASDPQWLTRRRLGLSTVVVTPPLQRWLCFDALSRFYAEAYNVQLNTRFQAKWTEYQQNSAYAENLHTQSGVGIVYGPLSKPLLPLVSVQTGLSPAETLFVQTAWVDALGQESALSPVNGVVLAANSTIVVAMAEGVVNAPPTAIGWNVYASSSQDDLTRQNNEPLAIGSTWAMGPDGLTEGPDPIDGQVPDYYVTLSNRIRRG